jgi:DNA-binding transcriptional regulator YdaS (Cro superfamily)
MMPDFIADLAVFCRGQHGRVSELAAHLGVAQPHVSAWLTGRQQPSGEHTLQIQAWLEARRKEPTVPTRRARRGGEIPPAAPREEQQPTPIWLL